MENVVIQLVNNLPPERFRHSIIAITEVMPEVAARIRRADVKLYALEKKPGQPFWRYPKMYRLLRRLKPDVWHSCNLAALEFSPLAWLASVPWRIHAEHGLEMDELSGKQPVYRWLRRLYRNCVHVYVAVSEPIADYLHQCIGIKRVRMQLIGNGVDLEHFRPYRVDDPLPLDYPFVKGEHWVAGTVGRQEPIKNPLLLVDAFIDLVNQGGPQAAMLRLAMVGQGSLHEKIAQRMQLAGMSERLWLPGNRNDVAEILRRFDCFVLPSISEGTSCTLQEALASALPVIATDVGGNRIVLDNGQVGQLIPSQNPSALLAAMQICLHGVVKKDQSRNYAESLHDLNKTIQAYNTLFERSHSAVGQAR